MIAARPSVGKRIEIEHRVDERTGLAERRQPALEDGVDVAALLHADQRTVDRKAEIGIVASHDDRIRLEREILR